MRLILVKEKRPSSAVNDPVVESASDPIPEASSNTDTNVFLPAITSGSDVEETNQEADTSPTSALTPVPTTVPDPTAAPTATAEPSSLTLGLAVERDKDTLFVYQSKRDFPLHWLG